MFLMDTNSSGHSAILLKDKEPKTACRLVYAEVLASPKLEDELIRSKAVSFSDKLDIKWQEVNYNVLIEAANLRRQQPGLKLIDALHIASAIIAHAETFFSNHQDLQLLKISELNIKSL